jgi:sugar phosphate isomerase/epimerase
VIPTLNPVTTGFHVPFLDFLDAASAGNFPAIEYGIVPFSNVAKKQSKEAAIELLTSRGLVLGSFGLPVEFRKDEQTFKNELTELPRHAALARAMGVTRCCTYLWPTTDEPVAEYTCRFVRRLRESAKVLNEYGIRFGIEWVGTKSLRTMKHDFIHTIPGALELIGAIGEKNVGLLFDSFHWYTSKATKEDILALTADQIVLVHIDDAPDKPVDEQIDNERLLPGEGIIDLKTMLNSLKQIGYESYISVETFSKELPLLPPDEVAIKTMASVNRVLATL